MCGIVGAIGTNEAIEIVINGLERLEYRGYDSCGVAYLYNNEYKVVKSTERVHSLRDIISEKSTLSFGHTRWATHGQVTLENAHPHKSYGSEMVIVHNGVVENFEQLIEEYELNGKLKSQTDTEVLVNILEIEYAKKKSMDESFKTLIKKVEGSYACIVSLNSESEKLYVVKNKTPLLIGKAENYFTISSDPIAVSERVENFLQLNDQQYAIIDSESNEIKLKNKDGEERPVNFEKYNVEELSLKKSADYSTYMEKEIAEQAVVLRNIVNFYQTMTWDENLLKTLENSEKLYIVASGTSYHSGLAVKRLIEKDLKIPVEPVIGSEFGYDNNLIPEKSFFIFISQSGETADSMVVFNKIKDDYPTLALTNVKGSQLDRNSTWGLPLYAGVEIAVASTKAYISQIAVVNILLAKITNDENIYSELLIAADKIEKCLNQKNEFKKIAKEMVKYNSIFYLGRLVDYALGQEAALKIKEITYKNVNAYAAGELKHGPISLIDENSLINIIISDKSVASNTRSNIQEVKARKGNVVIFSTTDTQEKNDDLVIDVEGLSKRYHSLVVIVPHQYLSYYGAVELGLDVDKPRNLAKSVTVE